MTSTTRAYRLAAIAATAIMATTLLLGFGWTPADATHSITLTDCSPPSSPAPAPPQASPRPSATPAPTEPCVPVEGQTVSGTWTLRFEVEDEPQRRRVRSAAFQLRPTRDCDDPTGFGGTPFFGTVTDQPPGQPIDLTWNTAQTSPRNGIYDIHIAAAVQDPGGGEHTASDVRCGVKVINPPKTPARPEVLVATAEGVSLRWAEATEPDFVSFTLERAKTASRTALPADKAFAPILTTENTRTLDPVKEKGTYWYRLRSTRATAPPPSTSTITSAPSASSSPAVIGEAQPSAEPGSTVAPAKRSAKRTLSRREVQRLRSRALVSQRLRNRGAPLPDAPYSAYLPYDPTEPGAQAGAPGFDAPEEGADPRGPLLPVAVGAFLVSAALAVGRLPR